MKVKTHESQNAEEGYVFRLSAPETILQNKQSLLCDS